MSDRWLRKLERDELVVIDGGTGTELQRRGAVMDESTWSGMAVVTHPELVRACHEDYIRAGAEVIITNTFGCSRQAMAGAGHGDQVPDIVATAVRLASEARDATDADVAIAGSISAMSAGFERETFLPPDQERDAYCEIAQALAEGGVDLIALEMMDNTVHAPLAIEAALETGLPLWLGVSARLAADRSSVVSHSVPSLGFDKLLDTLLDHRIALLNLMHTTIEAVDPAIEIVLERWSGAFGVYPESGYFVRPDWQFVDVIEPEELAAHAKRWVARGARLLGGCCGTGPEHVRALARLRAGSREAVSE